MMRSSFSHMGRLLSGASAGLANGHFPSTFCSFATSLSAYRITACSLSLWYLALPRGARSSPFVPLSGLLAYAPTARGTSGRLGLRTECVLYFKSQQPPLLLEYRKSKAAYGQNITERRWSCWISRYALSTSKWKGITRALFRTISVNGEGCGGDFSAFYSNPFLFPLPTPEFGLRIMLRPMLFTPHSNISMGRVLDAQCNFRCGGIITLRLVRKYTPLAYTDSLFLGFSVCRGALWFNKTHMKNRPTQCEIAGILMGGFFSMDVTEWGDVLGGDLWISRYPLIGLNNKT